MTNADSRRRPLVGWMTKADSRRRPHEHTRWERTRPGSKAVKLALQVGHGLGQSLRHLLLSSVDVALSSPLLEPVIFIAKLVELLLLCSYIWWTEDRGLYSQRPMPVTTLHLANKVYLIVCLVYEITLCFMRWCIINSFHQFWWNQPIPYVYTPSVSFYLSLDSAKLHYPATNKKKQREY
jgi:hypothetical protein